MIGFVVTAVSMMCFLAYRGRKAKKSNYNEPYNFDAWVNN